MTSTFYGSGDHPASSVVKQPGHEANYSPPSSAEVKNMWSYISTLPYVFKVWCLVKQRDNFTLHLPLADVTHL
jgi:hypothetical protein